MLSRRGVPAAGGRLCHVVPGEASNPFVVVGEALELGASDVTVQILEGDIAHQLLHAADEIVGRMLAVGAYNPRRRSGSRGLVRLESGRWLAPRGEAIGERPRIEDGLGGAVGAAGVHRMRGVAEEGDPAEGPAVDGVPV